MGLEIFSWIGKLFLSQAEDAGKQVISDEIHKVHDEIAASIEPLLLQIPEADRQKALTEITEVAKQAAVAYAEAAINSRIPAVPALIPAPTTSSTQAPPAVQ